VKSSGIKESDNYYRFYTDKFQGLTLNIAKYKVLKIDLPVFTNFEDMTPIISSFFMSETLDKIAPDPPAAGAGIELLFYHQHLYSLI